MLPGRRFLFPSGKKSCCFSETLDKISESCYDGNTLNPAMRTGTKKCILLLLAIIVLCFAVWLLWPHSFAEVTGIPAEYPDLNMAAIVTAARFENGSPSFDIWNLQYCSAGSTEYEAVLSVLSSASYRQDLRNLLPGGLTSVSSDKDYDSRSVNLMFAWGRFEDECCSLTFSGSQVVVAGPNNRGFQVYHPIDPGFLDRLTAEVQTYGVKN